MGFSVGKRDGVWCLVNNRSGEILLKDISYEEGVELRDEMNIQVQERVVG